MENKSLLTASSNVQVSKYYIPDDIVLFSPNFLSNLVSDFNVYASHGLSYLITLIL
jgi:hypothetical protein